MSIQSERLSVPFLFPACTTALDDDALKGAPRDVYLRLTRQLDFVEYREKKSTVVALEMKMSDRTAAFALKRLCERGYLARGPKHGKVHTYRLVWSLSTALDASA